MIETLYTFYKNELVGKLYRMSNGQLEFEYSEFWLKKSGHYPISLNLPLTTGRFSSQQTQSYFENLIPEGEILEKIKQSSPTPIENEFDFLATYGHDCAGAFIIVPDLSFKKKYNPKTKKKLQLSTIYKAWRHKKGLIEALIEESEDFFSLAGAQDKIPIIFEDGNFFIPTQGGATTHILKSPIRHWENTQDSVYNEYFCMQLAARIGLNIAKCDIIEGDVPLFITERYDRKKVGPDVERIHQIDFCQAHGLLSHQKYEILGGPSFRKNYELLKELPGSTITDLENLLEWLFFNYYIGNHDNHSKNLSLLWSNHSWQIAPFYDLLSTAIYPQIRQKMAFKIGGQRDWKAIGVKQLEQLDKELKIRKGTSLSIALQVKTKVQAHLGELMSQHQQRFRTINTFAQIEKIFLSRAKQFC